MNCLVVFVLFTGSPAGIEVFAAEPYSAAMKITILFFGLIGSLGAQVPTGTIAGVVLDPSGAPVLGARLKVVSLATNVARAETSSEHGDYSFPALMAGEYEVTVEAGTFQRMVRTASVEAGATTGGRLYAARRWRNHRQRD